MITAAVCRNCAYTEELDVAPNEQDLLTVGMLERHCPACGRDTRWGRATDYRRRERRGGERRKDAAKVAMERRRTERRKSERRRRYV